jgi:hypothetical protein
MYAILKDDQLITQGYNGARFVTAVDGPSVYQVRTCRRRGDVVEFGVGDVEVTSEDILLSEYTLVAYPVEITDYRPVMLTVD